jgi:hypothetical protein
MSPSQILNQSGVWTMAGMFNLPICNPSPNWNLNAFFDALAEPGDIGSM